MATVNPASSSPQATTAEDTLQRKIRDAHARKVPYMAIVGDREAEAEHVNVRDRAGLQVDSSLDSFASMVAAEVAERRR